MVAPYTVVPNRNMRSILQAPDFKPYAVRPRRVGGPEWDTQRFYFRASATPSVSPAFDAAWEDTADARRRVLASLPSASDTLGVGDTRGFTTGNDRLDRQYVGPPMRAGVIITAATLSMVLQCNGFSSGADNVYPRLGARICSEDGGTFRVTLLAVDDYGLGIEIPHTTATAHVFASGEVLPAYTTQSGDRFVIEIGFSDLAGSTPNARALYGSSAATDHALANGVTTALNSWIEFTPAA